MLGTLLSAIFNGFLGARYYGHRGVITTSIIGLGVSFVSCLLLYYAVTLGTTTTTLPLMAVNSVWFSIAGLTVNWCLQYDLVAMQLLLTVLTVSFAVHCYALVYMREDPHLSLFISYLSFFTLFMQVLVAAQDLVVMLVGWEGIGVFSYLLIGYWNHRLSASKSAMKAVVVNRLSDGLLLFGILYVYYYTGTVEYDLIQLQPSGMLGTAILIGAMGKSAQILFHVWLADAMEGPTPVSALIHAATLVCAGVYVVVRLNTLYNTDVLLVGALTALMAGIFGMYQMDLKRVIAYSTCSQLGYMFVSVGLGDFGPDASICHLMTHASFKAALFLGAGTVIMASGGSNQHMARYGTLTAIHGSLISYQVLLIASLCLMALPGTSGFFSKELIINLSLVCYNPLAEWVHTVLVLAAMITCAYTVKLLLQCFVLGYGNSNFTLFNNIKPTNVLITIAFFVLLADVLIKIWVGTSLLNGILLFLPWGLKTLPVGLLLAGILTATSGVTTQQWSVSRMFGSRWAFDQIYALTMVHNVLDLGRITYVVGDRGVMLLRSFNVN
jgi:proton-translocating NADH-quinone oxidoreductase chain L